MQPATPPPHPMARTDQQHVILVPRRADRVQPRHAAHALPRGDGVHLLAAAARVLCQPLPSRERRRGRAVDQQRGRARANTRERGEAVARQLRRHDRVHVRVQELRDLGQAAGAQHLRRGAGEAVARQLRRHDRVHVRVQELHDLGQAAGAQHLRRGAGEAVAVSCVDTTVSTYGSRNCTTFSRLMLAQHLQRSGAGRAGVCGGGRAGADRKARGLGQAGADRKARELGQAGADRKARELGQAGADRKAR
eukprot:327749-Chlamydomonas_euryale.AAC.4